jgi:hypothetical protein
VEHVIALVGVGVGSLITVVAGWLQVRWQEGSRKSGEKRARVEGRFAEVREYLTAACELARAESELWSELLAPETSEVAMHQWGKRRRIAGEKLISSRVGVAPHLFLADGGALEKLLALQGLMRKMWEEDFVEEHSEIAFQSVQEVQGLAGEIQRRLDELMDHM